MNGMFCPIEGYRAFALSGRIPDHLHTQGDALGWSLVGLSGRSRQATPTSYTTSTPTSSGQDIFHTDNPLILNLVKVIGNSPCSIKEMLERVGLKDRKNFLEYHLTPAIREGFVSLLHPDKPRHPRQKYLLTVKGTLLYNELTKN